MSRRTRWGVHAASRQPAASSIETTAWGRPARTGRSRRGKVGLDPRVGEGGHRNGRVAGRTSPSRPGATTRRRTDGPRRQSPGRGWRRRRADHRRTSRRSVEITTSNGSSGRQVATSATTHSIGAPPSPDRAAAAAIISSDTSAPTTRPWGATNFCGAPGGGPGAAAHVEDPITRTEVGRGQEQVRHGCQLHLEVVGHRDPAARPVSGPVLRRVSGHGRPRYAVPPRSAIRTLAAAVVRHHRSGEGDLRRPQDGAIHRPATECPFARPGNGLLRPGCRARRRRTRSGCSRCSGRPSSARRCPPARRTVGSDPRRSSCAWPDPSRPAGIEETVDLRVLDPVEVGGRLAVPPDVLLVGVPTGVVPPVHDHLEVAAERRVDQRGLLDFPSS